MKRSRQSHWKEKTPPGRRTVGKIAFLICPYLVAEGGAKPRQREELEATLVSKVDTHKIICRIPVQGGEIKDGVKNGYTS